MAAVPEQERIIAAYRRGPRGDAWLADRAPVALVHLEAGTNQAVGEAPWGPAAARADVMSADEVPVGAKVALLGRGLAEDHPLWESVEALCAAGHHVVCVEGGMPHNERPDLVTCGASRGVGEAVTTLLLGAQVQA